jgi:hypothetical protein
MRYAYKRELNEMRDLARSTPPWIEAIGGDVVSSAIVDVGQSDTDPSYPHQIFLEVEVRPEGERGEDDSLAFLWRFGLARRRDDEGLGLGWAATLADAQHDCWQTVVAFWRNEGFSDEDIRSVWL